MAAAPDAELKEDEEEDELPPDDLETRMLEQAALQAKGDREEADGEGARMFETLINEGPQTSFGSEGHSEGCSPCAFYCFTRHGCNRGSECRFCHLQHRSKLQTRREAWKKQQREKRKVICDRGVGAPGDPPPEALSSGAYTAARPTGDGHNRNGKKTSSNASGPASFANTRGTGAGAAAVSSKRDGGQAGVHRGVFSTSNTLQAAFSYIAEQDRRLQYHSDDTGGGAGGTYNGGGEAFGAFAGHPGGGSAVGSSALVNSGSGGATAGGGSSAETSLRRLQPAGPVAHRAEPSGTGERFTYNPGHCILALGQQVEFAPNLDSMQGGPVGAGCFWLSEAQLPQGLWLDQATGIISGAALVRMVRTCCVIQASWASGRMATATVSVEVIDFADGNFSIGLLEELEPGRFMMLMHVPEEEDADDPTWCRERDGQGGQGVWETFDQVCPDGGAAASQSFPMQQLQNNITGELAQGEDWTGRGGGGDLRSQQGTSHIPMLRGGGSASLRDAESGQRGRGGSQQQGSRHWQNHWQQEPLQAESYDNASSAAATGSSLAAIQPWQRYEAS